MKLVFILKLYPEPAQELLPEYYMRMGIPEEILSFFKKKVFREFAEFTIPHGGFFKSDGFRSFLKKHQSQTFEDLKIPLADCRY